MTKSSYEVFCAVGWRFASDSRFTPVRRSQRNQEDIRLQIVTVAYASVTIARDTFAQPCRASVTSLATFEARADDLPFHSVHLGMSGPGFPIYIAQIRCYWIYMILSLSHYPTSPFQYFAHDHHLFQVCKEKNHDSSNA